MIEKLQAVRGRRIVMSDLHGHLDHLDKALAALSLTGDDQVIFLGDLINKGPHSFEVLKRAKALEEAGLALVLKGNHEHFIAQHLQNKESFTPLFDWLRKDPYKTIITDWLERHDLDISSFSEADELFSFLWQEYEPWIHYMNELPFLAEDSTHIYVHGGYEGHLLTTNPAKLLKFDDYDLLASVQDKTVIVGHWPAANLRKNQHSNAPYFNQEKNIITIDGGLGVKTSGELNVFIIPNNEKEPPYEVLQIDDFEPLYIAKEISMLSEEAFFVNYPDFSVIPLAENGPLTLCRHIASGSEISVFNSLLDTSQDPPQVKITYINHFPHLEAGTQVKRVISFEDCHLIKHENEFGWILRDQST